MTGVMLADPSLTDAVAVRVDSLPNLLQVHIVLNKGLEN